MRRDNTAVCIYLQRETREALVDAARSCGLSQREIVESLLRDWLGLPEESSAYQRVMSNRMAPIYLEKNS